MILDHFLRPVRLCAPGVRRFRLKAGERFQIEFHSNGNHLSQTDNQTDSQTDRSHQIGDSDRMFTLRFRIENFNLKCRCWCIFTDKGSLVKSLY